MLSQFKQIIYGKIEKIPYVGFSEANALNEEAIIFFCNYYAKYGFCAKHVKFFDRYMYMLINSYSVEVLVLLVAELYSKANDLGINLNKDVSRFTMKSYFKFADVARCVVFQYMKAKTQILILNENKAEITHDESVVLDYSPTSIHKHPKMNFVLSIIDFDTPADAIMFKLKYS